MRIKKTKQTIKTNSPRRRGKKGWEEKNKKEDNTNEIDQVKKRGKKGVWAVKMGDKRRGWEVVYKKGGEKEEEEERKKVPDQRNQKKYAERSLDWTISEQYRIVTK